MGWGVRAAALVASAVLFYFGTGFTPVPVLAALAPLPILWLAPRIGAWAAAGLAALAFVLGTTNCWALYADSVDIPVPMAVMIVLGTAAVFVLVTLLFRALVRRGMGLLATVAAPAVHVSGWYLASVFSPAGEMGTLATGQADVPVVLQVASLTGALGVDYLLMLVPAAVAAVLSPGVRRARVASVTVTAVAAALAFGTIRLAAAPDAPAQSVALIGGNAKGQWATEVTSDAGRAKLADYAREVTRLDADLVVLPEGAFAATDATLPTLTAPLREAARAHGTTVVVGVIVNDRNNSALTISATADSVEYRKWHDRGPKIVPGDDLVHIPGTHTGLLVCGDVNFENPFRDYAAANTELMAIPASDETLNGWQHSRTALLRAVENGVGIAWAAQRGTNLAADAWGRTAASADTDNPTQVTVATLPTGAAPTLYARWGDWFAWLCLALTALGTLALFRKPEDFRNEKP